MKIRGINAVPICEIVELSGCEYRGDKIDHSITRRKNMRVNDLFTKNLRSGENAAQRLC